jgi:hypothetical protein
MSVGKILPSKVTEKQMKTFHAEYYYAACPSTFVIVKSVGILQNY